jgi:hypothetical protein
MSGEFEPAGFMHAALVQVGRDTQERFLTWAATNRCHPPASEQHDLA